MQAVRGADARHAGQSGGPSTVMLRRDGELSSTRPSTTTISDRCTRPWRASFRARATGIHARTGILSRWASAACPMETAACPQCGAQIGGQHHRPAEGGETCAGFRTSVRSTGNVSFC